EQQGYENNIASTSSIGATPNQAGQQEVTPSSRLGTSAFSNFKRPRHVVTNIQQSLSMPMELTEPLLREGESEADRQVSKRFGVSAPQKVEELAYPSQTAPPSIATPAMDTDGGSDVGGGGGDGSVGQFGVSSFPDLPLDDEAP
ncbi:unnamed protein product, partial [Ectocarpus sp. 12 AP-2014]